MMFKPQFEDEQCPQLFAIVLGSAQMLVNQASDFNRVEDALLSNVRLGEGIEHEAAEFISEPFGHGNAEALLASPQNFRGQLVAHRFFQNVFAVQPLELEAKRNRIDEFDKGIVQE